MRRLICAVLRCLMVLILPSKFILHLSSCYREDIDLSIKHCNED